EVHRGQRRSGEGRERAGRRRRLPRDVRDEPAGMILLGHVLVIDDERILADSIAAYLEHHGFSTVVAFSGEDGLQRAEATSPDVAIVDVRLPGMNGIEVLRRLREMLPTIEVLMVTAHASVASAVDAMKLGAFDYVMKPVDLDELRFIVDKARTHQRMRQELTYLEAELFGYERGAYTDAKTAKAGLFEAADGGTLFLDEIGHVELALQIKLLKVIEQKAIRRLGGLRTKTVNVRIVTATNRDLERAIGDGEFRDDLYYRINAITLVVPPLRSRSDDIMLLARHFLDHYRQQYGFPPNVLSPE